ncbi:unnamed protein product [Paramecium sonneborni]|uniref:Uncharacterized protein n=1 Tax=Paramecium sonneborni TaxID=65129 RepID=A0A8S1R5T8_9CILI|nr:unnamed protein product [Paramecium sonneborni]
MIERYDEMILMFELINILVGGGEVRRVVTINNINKEFNKQKKDKDN